MYFTPMVFRKSVPGGRVWTAFMSSGKPNPREV